MRCLTSKMPELPEVETIARRLNPALTGKAILSADLYWARTLATPSQETFLEGISGRTILKVSRRAKYLVISLDYGYLLIHLRMSGDLFLRPKTEKPEKHDRLSVQLSDEQALVFNDTRKFGRVWLVSQAETILGSLGAEPLEGQFTPGWLFQNLHRRRRLLKPLLLDQTFLAGLGNIYTDEALHLARLHPCMPSDQVTASQAGELHQAIRSVLLEGIRRNGASIDWVYRGGGYQNYFRVYDRQGTPCPVCGIPIEKFTVGQRGTHICPSCQKLA